MTAKEYLGQVKFIIIRLQSLSRQVNSLEDALTGTSVCMSGMPGAATPNAHRMEKLIATKLDLERKIDIQSNRLAAITNAINSLPRTVHTAVLTARYIAGMDWRAIANELRISVSRLYELHRDALAEFDKVRSKP